MGRYHTLFKRISDITDAEQEAMITLYLAYYDGSSAEQIKTDLAAKSEALLLYHGDRLVGFTTLHLYHHAGTSEPILVVYSGDTIVAQDHWGQQALAIAWIGRMGELAAERPDTPLYWFVIVKGHRTYRYLPTFARSFHPHWEADRSDLKALADRLAEERFGSDYNVARGVVEFARSKGHLKPEIAEPGESERNREAVRFFLKKNPGYRRGHELVCLCELREENLRPLARRVFQRGRHG